MFFPFCSLYLVQVYHLPWPWDDDDRYPACKCRIRRTACQRDTRTIPHTTTSRFMVRYCRQSDCLPFQLYTNTIALILSGAISPRDGMSRIFLPLSQNDHCGNAESVCINTMIVLPLSSIHVKFTPINMFCDVCLCVLNSLRSILDSTEGHHDSAYTSRKRNLSPALLFVSCARRLCVPHATTWDYKRKIDVRPLHMSCRPHAFKLA